MENNKNGLPTLLVISSTNALMHRNSTVKRAWTRIILGLMTLWEVLLLHLFHPFYSKKKKKKFGYQYPQPLRICNITNIKGLEAFIVEISMTPFSGLFLNFSPSLHKPSS